MNKIKDLVVKKVEEFPGGLMVKIPHHHSFSFGWIPGLGTFACPACGQNKQTKDIGTS